MKTSIETIDSERAKRLLAHNGMNRRRRQSLIDRLAGAIRRNEWVLNGEAIKLGEDGRLQDGQHRLAAVVEADKPIETVVIYGVADQAQETIDIGAKRTMGDMFSLRGEKDVNVLAASTRLVWTYLNHRTMAYPPVMPTPQELFETLDNHPTLRDYIYDPGRRVYDVLKFPTTMGTALGYLFTLTDEQAAEFFFDRLETGENLTAGHPALVLRNQLGRDAQKDRRASTSTAGAWAIKAFNAMRNGDEVAKFGWQRSNRKKKELFPLIDGFPEHLYTEEPEAT